MENGDLKASNYLYFLYTLKKELMNKTLSEQDKIWMVHFTIAKNKGFNIENLPYLFALIHPDFYYKEGYSFQSSLSWKKKADFTRGIRGTSTCQSKHITQIECIFNCMPEIRGTVEADHRWPNSLGGPSIFDNRLLLCKYHNGMKSNDISKYSWNIVPSWLEEYMNQIYSLKL